MSIALYFDGACDNNSRLKLMGIGVAVFIDDTYFDALSAYKFVGSGTSNIAEWEALTKALRMAIGLVETYSSSVRIYGDSQLIVRQYGGIYEVKREEFKPYHEEAMQLSLYLGKSLKSVSWIPRQENKHADKLSKRAITEFIKNEMQ